MIKPTLQEPLPTSKIPNYFTSSKILFSPKNTQIQYIPISVLQHYTPKNPTSYLNPNFKEFLDILQNFPR